MEKQNNDREMEIFCFSCQENQKEAQTETVLVGCMEII